MIQVHYLYCALYFLNYYISSTTDRQALDHRGRGPLLHSIQCVWGKPEDELLILSVLLGPGFDPCCHFLGPRKLRQEGVCWVGGEGGLEIFSLSKQQLMWLVETKVKKCTHILALWLWFFHWCLWKPTQVSIFPGRQCWRERWLFVSLTVNPPVALSVRSFTWGGSWSLIVQGPPSQSWSVKLSLSPCGFWLHSPGFLRFQILQ